MSMRFAAQKKGEAPSKLTKGETNSIVPDRLASKSLWRRHPLAVDFPNVFLARTHGR